MSGVYKIAMVRMFLEELTNLRMYGSCDLFSVEKTLRLSNQAN